ncbi:MAG: hypothetical protein EA001_10200 [Oscillatoriales cyanobacterium]|nr:MAG: hypothetical protein EA001_10200 [Oscillatoriales cyanobacterium]
MLVVGRLLAGISQQVLIPRPLCPSWEEGSRKLGFFKDCISGLQVLPTRSGERFRMRVWTDASDARGLAVADQGLVLILWATQRD